MARLDLENVKKTFGRVCAVDNLSFTVQDGEFVSLLGPSGCGKSTTLNLIAGLEELTSGSIRLDGKSIDDLPPNRRDMAMVFQDYALYPHMSVFKNLSFNLKLRKVRPAVQKETVARVAKMLDIDNLLDRYPRELSGGQQQRVALGRAIVRDPKVFLLDEPLSNLDERLRVRMRTELKELFLTLHTTTIYVTHDQEEAMSMSDKIAVLHNGALEQFGTPDEIFSSPRNVFVASFVGSPPINLVRGSLTREGDAYRFQSGPLDLCFPLAFGRKLKNEGVAAGSEVILGIRPEHLKVNGVPTSLALTAQVSLLEPLGYFTVVSLTLANAAELRAIVTTGEQLLKRGDQVSVAVDLEKILVFDARTEESLVA